MPGSAAMLSITVLVSTAMTPTGTPPSRARPVTTVRAQPACRQQGAAGRVGGGSGRLGGLLQVHVSQASTPGS